MDVKSNVIDDVMKEIFIGVKRNRKTHHGDD